MAIHSLMDLSDLYLICKRISTWKIKTGSSTLPNTTVSLLNQAIDVSLRNNKWSKKKSQESP